MVPVTYGSGSVNARINRSPRSTAVRFGFLSIRMIGFLIIALFALMYVAQSSQGANLRIDKEKIRTQSDMLGTEESQLLLEAKRLQSLDTISQSTGSFDLEPVQNVEFLGSNAH